MSFNEFKCNTHKSWLPCCTMLWESLCDKSITSHFLTMLLPQGWRWFHHTWHTSNSCLGYLQFLYPLKSFLMYYYLTVLFNVLVDWNCHFLCNLDYARFLCLFSSSEWNSCSSINFFVSADLTFLCNHFQNWFINEREFFL